MPTVSRGEVHYYWPCAILRAVASTRTNNEVEIKLPVNDLPALVRRLHKLGAVSRGRVFEQNTLYDTPDSALRGGGCLLRLRVETPAGSSLMEPGPASAVVTSKAPPRRDAGRASGRSAKPRYKERMERELTIRKPAYWPRTLELLGFRFAFRYEKYRTSFRLRGLHVDLDETPIGTFLELEGAPRAIERVAAALGYAPRDYSRATYSELYVADCRRRKRPVKNMVFYR